MCCLIGIINDVDDMDIYDVKPLLWDTVTFFNKA